MSYFVKFNKFNENTLSSLINKTAKFSTVYEFNDFNELMNPCVAAAPFEDEALKKELSHYYKDPLNIAKVFENAYYSGGNDRDVIAAIKGEILSSDAFKVETWSKELFRIFCENAIYSSIGILCLSHIDVFKSNKANLMFAHYADNLQGLALIYQNEMVENKSLISPIRYKAPHKREIPTYPRNQCLNWIKNNFNNMGAFLTKSDVWAYEEEHRIFGTPGIKDCKEAGIKLRGILYTPRFKRAHKETLNLINQAFYAGELFIEEIIPSVSPSGFNIQKEGQRRNMKDWLDSNLK